MEERKRRKVLCPVQNEKTGRTYWMKLGIAFENRDGSTNIYLDALPVNGKLQLREFDERDAAAEFRPREVTRESPTANDALPF